MWWFIVTAATFDGDAVSLEGGQGDAPVGDPERDLPPSPVIRHLVTAAEQLRGPVVEVGAVGEAGAAHGARLLHYRTVSKT